MTSGLPAGFHRQYTGTMRDTLQAALVVIFIANACENADSPQPLDTGSLDGWTFDFRWKNGMATNMQPILSRFGCAGPTRTVLFCDSSTRRLNQRSGRSRKLKAGFWVCCEERTNSVNTRSNESLATSPQRCPPLDRPRPQLGSQVVNRLGQPGALLVSLVEQIALNLRRNQVRSANPNQPNEFALDPLRR